jgi:hypothetical protein
MPMMGPAEGEPVTPTAREARWWPAGLAWALWLLTLLAVAATAWFDQLLRRAGRPELVQLNAEGGVTLLLAAVSAATSGAVLASRRPRHPVGWLLLAFGLSLNAAGVALASTNYGVAHPDAPVAGLVASYVPATIVTAIVCNGLILLLTPTGTLPSPRWWCASAAPAASNASSCAGWP